MVVRKSLMVGALTATVLAMGSVVAQASSLGFHNAAFSYNGTNFGTYNGAVLTSQTVSYGPGAGSAGFISFQSNATSLGGGLFHLSNIIAKIFNSSNVLVFEAKATGATLDKTAINAFAFNFTGLHYLLGLSGVPTGANVILNTTNTPSGFKSLPNSTQGAFNATPIPELSSTLGLAGMVLGGGLLGFRRRRSK